MEFLISVDPEQGRLENRLGEVKELYATGLNYNLFWSIIHNLHNGPTSSNRLNSFDIDGWVEFYAQYQIILSAELLELVFEYVRKHYGQILRKNSSTEYLQLLHYNISADENPFGFELIVLKSLEV